MIESDKYYIMLNELTGLYKIGICSKSTVNQRKKQLENASGMRIKLIWYGIEEEDELGFMEKQIHRYFKEKRIIGEWFNIKKIEVLSVINFFDGNGIEPVFIDEEYKDFLSSRPIELWKDDRLRLDFLSVATSKRIEKEYAELWN